ncbi:IclR family transcriptional regulator [Embleya hyalina]|uniref:IclR family transcriptional regulator n=1 Tax=Embleya hyalina TaxID=516124 RepID=A0A401YDX5_9ACTN|nr:IclR family transcriptional regulator [Embleya hyalina]GCD92809.1 IclR family transcriptional regulator [Embleya hyalina]
MNPAERTPKQPTLQTVDRALTFLEYVAAAPEPPTVQQVSEALGLNITTCYHLLRTLVARGYIARHENLTLTLGDGVGALFRAYQRRFDIDDNLKGCVDKLAAQTAETSYFSAVEGNRVILRILVEGSQPLRVSGLFVGRSGDEHLRSSGKAVLAHLDDERRAAVMANCVEGRSETDASALVEKLDRDLRTTRERGWSLDEQDSDIGISSVGAPVFDARREVYGAVGIVVPTTRMEKHRQRYVECVTATAAAMTALLEAAGVR